MFSVRSPPGSQWLRPQALEVPLTPHSLPPTSNPSASPVGSACKMIQDPTAPPSSLAFILAQLRVGELGYFYTSPRQSLWKAAPQCAHPPALWPVASMVRAGSGS